MKWYKITWNSGLGESYRFEKCVDLIGAESVAADEWQEEAESNAEHAAEILTRDDVMNYGEDPEMYWFEPLRDDE